MMNHRLKNNLFGSSSNSAFKITNEKTTLAATRSITSYIREFDFEVHLDNFQGTETPTPAIFIKGDKNTSVLNARIFRGGLPVNLEGITVTVNIKEARGKSTIPAKVIDNEGLVRINLPSSTVDETGVNYFELVFQSGDQVLVSPTYTYKVLNSLGEGTFGSNADKTVLQSLIEEVQNSKSMVDNVIEESKDTLEDTLQEFENEIDNTLQETNDRVGNIILGFENEIEGVIQESRVEIDVTLQESRETIQETKDTINTIVEELEITQSDIDDIMAMVGDL